MKDILLSIYMWFMTLIETAEQEPERNAKLEEESPDEFTSSVTSAASEEDMAMQLDAEPNDLSSDKSLEDETYEDANAQELTESEIEELLDKQSDEKIAEFEENMERLIETEKIREKVPERPEPVPILALDAEAAGTLSATEIELTEKVLEDMDVDDTDSALDMAMEPVEITSLDEEDHY